jgi:PST family polysaccharide transporter
LEKLFSGLLQYLPESLAAQVNVLRNIGWLVFDKIYRMGVGMLVGIWLARYLGPGQFGLLNYANALVSIFLIVSTVGMEAIVVKELVDHPEKTSVTLSTALFVRVLGSVVFFITCVACIYLIGDQDQIIIGLIISLTIILQPINTIDLFYQAEIKSKYTVLSQNIAFTLTTVFRIVLILVFAQLWLFAWAVTIEALLAALFLMYSYFVLNKRQLNFQFNKRVAWNLLGKSWPLTLSSLMIMIYMKIDQVMLGEMIGDFEVGVYSAALKVSEIWYFIPVVICNSFFPSLIQAKKSSEEAFRNKTQRLLDTLAAISISISIAIMFFSNAIMSMLYGVDYYKSGVILTLHIWTSVFVFIGVGGSNFFLIENLQVKGFIRTAIGAGINIILNFILIPIYHSIGAALATLIAQIFVCYLFDAFSKRTWHLFTMKSKSLIGYNFFKLLLR